VRGFGIAIYVVAVAIVLLFASITPTIRAAGNSLNDDVLSAVNMSSRRLSGSTLFGKAFHDSGVLAIARPVTGPEQRTSALRAPQLSRRVLIRLLSDSRHQKPVPVLSYASFAKNLTSIHSTGANSIAARGLRRNPVRFGSPIMNTVIGEYATGEKPWWAESGGVLGGIGRYAINVSSGNLLVQSSDMDVPDRALGFAFHRSFNSEAGHTYSNLDGSGPSLYGDNWTNSFDIRAVYNEMQTNNSCGVQQGITIFDGAGSQYDYAPAGDCSTWIPPAGIHALLYLDNGSTGNVNWLLPDGTHYYFNSLTQNPNQVGQAGLINAIYGRNLNNYLEFNRTWQPDATDPHNVSTITVTAEDGRSATLQFSNFQAPNNGPIFRLLQSLTWPDGSTTVTYSYKFYQDQNNNYFPELYHVTEPSNGAPTGSPVQEYLYWAPYPIIAYIGSPRWVASAGGPRYSFGYDYQVIDVSCIGDVNPEPSDGTNTYLQPNAIPDFGTSSAYQYATITYPAADPSPGATANTTISDLDGHQSTLSWDNEGRTVQISTVTGDASPGPVALTSGQTWDANNNLTSTTDPRNLETDIAYDNEGRAIAIALPAASPGAKRPTSYLTYDQTNNVVASCDPTWSDANNLDWTATPGPNASPCPANASNTPQNPGPTLDGFTYPSYELYGEPHTVTKPMGYQASFSYSIGAEGGSVDYGLPTQIQGAQIVQSGSDVTPTQDLTYDQYGNLVCSAVRQGTDGSPTWATTVYAYQSSGAQLLGRVTEIGDPDDASLTSSACSKSPGISGSTITTTLTYYANGQLASQMSPVERPYNQPVLFTYDSDGNRTSETRHFGGASPAPGVTTRYYDGADRLVEVVLPGSWQTRYLYDLSQNGSQTGNQVSLTGVSSLTAHGGLFKTTEYHPIGWIDMNGQSYDDMGRVTNKYTYAPNSQCGLNPTATCESTSISSFKYDVSGDKGLLYSSTDAIGTTTSYSYDNLSRLISQSFSDNTIGRQASYDLNSRVLTLTSGPGGLGALAYAYDRDGNEIKKTEQPNDNSDRSVISYGRYLNGWPSSISVAPYATGAMNQTNLFQYTYEADGHPLNETFNFGSLSKTFTFGYSAGGRLETQADPYSTSTITYDQAAGRIQSLALPELTTTFQAFDAEGETLQFTEGTSNPTTQAFDILGELVQQTPPGNNPDGCPAGFTQSGSDGYLANSAWVPDSNGVCYSKAVDENEDVRNAIQTSELSGIECCHGLQLYGVVTFDADGRLTVGYSPNSTTSYKRFYNALNEFNLQTDSSNNVQMKRAYGADGLPAQIGTADSNHTLHWETIHWAGDRILFTTNASGQVDDIKIGTIADYMPLDPSQNAQLTIWDKDATGEIRGAHNASGHSSWSVLDPYTVSVNSTAICSSGSGFTAPVMFSSGEGIGQGGGLSRRNSDGYWDGFVSLQGVRDFDPLLRGWTEPDPSSGSAWNPMSQKRFTWNNNNPAAFGDNSGLSPAGILTYITWDNELVEIPPDGNPPQYTLGAVVLTYRACNISGGGCNYFQDTAYVVPANPEMYAQFTSDQTGIFDFGAITAFPLFFAGLLEGSGAAAALEAGAGAGAAGGSVAAEQALARALRPPGWNENWQWRYPEGDSPSSPRWFDENGGEWRYHDADQYHPSAHWDYNPWSQWNSPWQNVTIEN
jgi:YD repeat-containing protein